jgi:hypothetical protein
LDIGVNTQSGLLLALERSSTKDGYHDARS